MTDTPQVNGRRQSDPRIDKLVKDVDRILIVIEGIPDYNANNQIIGYIGGMRNKLDELEHRGNGGGGFSLRARDKAQITGLFAIVVTVLNAASKLV